MSVLHRPLDLSGIPDEVTGARTEASRFTATWRQTEKMLQAEADHLAGRMASNVDVFIEVDLPASAIRLDGGIKSTRTPASHVVAVTVPHRELGELRLVAGRYVTSWGEYLTGWQANVRAVALTLKAMRDMARWGAATGQQYRGFAAIGATSTGTALGTGLTPADALAMLVTGAGSDPDDYDMTAADRPDTVASLYRRAAAIHHPDAGGNPAVFARLTEARDLLLKGLR